MKLIFLPSEEGEIFLGIDSITLGFPSQAYLKHQKYMFAISLLYLKENLKNEVNF